MFEFRGTGEHNDHSWVSQERSLPWLPAHLAVVLQTNQCQGFQLLLYFSSWENPKNGGYFKCMLFFSPWK